MAEELTQAEKDALATAAAAKEAEKKKQEDDITIPKSRFDEVNSKKKELEDKLAAIEAEKKAEAEKRMAEEGKTKELLEIREKEVAALRLDILKRDLIQDAITNQKLHPKLAKMVVGSTEEELKKSLEDAIAYNKEIDETVKNDKTAKDNGAGKGKSDTTRMSTEEWMTLYQKDPKAANDYLAKLTAEAQTK